MTTKKSGIVKFWHGPRGYGFLSRDDGLPDIFAHISEVPDAFDELAPGQRVEFEIVESEKKPGHHEARNIEVII
jgi:CspA family cold shock protein